MNVNLRQIQALVSIARLGSFTKAARDLHLSQPALTVQIHHLEEALGMRLLDRNTRSVKLTTSGKEVVPIFESVLLALEGVMANGRQNETTTNRSTITIAALPWVCATMLAPLIAIFHKQQPNLHVTLRDGTAQQIVTQVKNEEVDFGIACVVEHDSAIRQTPCFVDHLKVVFPSNHPLKRLKTIAITDLCSHPLIILNPGTSVRFLVDQAFQSIGQLPMPAYEVGHTVTALALVRAGLGVSIVSSSALSASSTARLVSRQIRHPGFVRTISMIQKSSRKLNATAESLQKFLLAGNRH